MGIYRGPGGPGDATADSTNEALRAIEAAAEAELSRDEAADSAASALSSANTATTKASEASTSATNAATSETNASDSATSASTSASTATTQASNASTSATNAASSASSASTSASTATTQATNAATSASNASTSASAAAGSATSASAAADAALSALDSFDDRYLGTKSSDPTLDNDGNALVSGALYFNTVENAMKVYDGSLWLAAYASISGALIATNNLSDLNDVVSARTNLGLGTSATTDSTAYATAAQGALADSALQSYTETDPIYTSSSWYTTTNNSSNWNTAYSWGNHASAGYLDSSNIGVDVQGYDADTTKNDVANTFTANQVISVTDNTNAALRVTQAGTGDAFLVEDEANPDSTPFVVKNDGKVGIGTASPSYELEVQAAEPISRVYATNAGLASMIQISNPSNAMMIGKDREGSSGWYGSSGEYIIAGNGDYPMNFWVNSGKRMSITGAGDVSIGATDTSGVGGQLDGVRVVATTGPKSSISQFRYTADSGSPNLRFYKSRSASVGGFTAVQSFDTLSALQTFAADGTSWISSAQISSYVDGTVSTGVIPTALLFATMNSSGNLTNNAQIRANGDFEFNSGYGTLATAYGCRAWVNFNGTGTVAIRASGNVSSITDHAVGKYTINFTTAMPDANYSVSGSALHTDGTGFSMSVSLTSLATPVAGSCRISVAIPTLGFRDPSVVDVAVFR